MHAAVRAALACPDCRARLDDEGDGLVCTGCGRRFAVESGVPRLLPASSPGQEWEAKQELGEASYAEHADGGHLAERFGRFAALRGLVLDVGSGAGRPAYLQEHADVTFVGLDPLPGAMTLDFDFVQGLAERLPFSDATFDGAISATMLDHVVDPSAVLLEVKRVLRPGGTLALWIAVVDDRELRANAFGGLALPPRQGIVALLRRHGLVGTASRVYKHLIWNRVRAAATTLRLRFARRRVVGEVYADRARYHFWFFEVDDVLELLRQTGFRVLASERVETDGEGTSLFVRAEAPA
jgi:SAM-dependent methyltransferase